jgi:hypothetical protein
MEKESELRKYSVYEKLEKLPLGGKATDTKWVLTIRGNNDGTVDKYKARKVMQGFTQENQKHCSEECPRSPARRMETTDLTWRMGYRTMGRRKSILKCKSGPYNLRKK